MWYSASFTLGLCAMPLSEPVIYLVLGLISEKQYTYDGTVADPKIIQTDYQYDNYGNITKKSELGDSSITGDERYTYNEYVYNPSLWIIDTLAHSVLKAADDSTKVTEHWRYYDNDPNGAPATTPPPATRF